jgi:hypothetical protein
MDILLHRSKNGIVSSQSDYKNIVPTVDTIKDCPNCGSYNITIEDQNYICTDCLYLIDICYFDDHSMSYKNKENELFPNIKSLVSISGSGSANNRLRNNFTYVSIPPEEKSINDVYKNVITKYQRHLDIINKYDTKCVSKDLIIEALLIYKKIVEIKGSRRHPLKSGIIAVCFYYVCKEKYIILTKKELATIFEIKQFYIAKAHKIINDMSSDNQDLSNMLNTTPITIYDILEKIQYKFETITQEDIENLRIILKRIENSKMIMNNTPIPVVSGILFNYVQVYNIKGITMKSIIEKLSVSDSSIERYATFFKFAVYKNIPIQK